MFGSVETEVPWAPSWPEELVSELFGADDVGAFLAEDLGFLAEGFLGEGFLGEDFLGEGFLGEGFLGEGFLGEDFLGEDFLGEGFLGEGFLGEGFLGEDFLGCSSVERVVARVTRVFEYRSFITAAIQSRLDYSQN